MVYFGSDYVFCMRVAVRGGYFQNTAIAYWLESQTYTNEHKERNNTHSNHAHSTHGLKLFLTAFTSPPV